MDQVLGIHIKQKLPDIKLPHSCFLEAADGVWLKAVSNKGIIAF